MPITARLSRNFYDRLGDDVADELVSWFNMIDTAYRADLRELNDRNFERFESRLAQALAEHGAGLRKEIADQGAALRVEIADQGANLRVEIADQGASLRVEMTQMSTGLRSDMASMEDRLGQRISALEVRTARETVIQTRWIIGLWAAQITAFIGTIFIVMQR